VVPSKDWSKSLWFRFYLNLNAEIIFRHFETHKGFILPLKKKSINPLDPLEFRMIISCAITSNDQIFIGNCAFRQFDFLAEMHQRHTVLR
jgi:hypothetical protein